MRYTPAQKDGVWRHFLNGNKPNRFSLDFLRPFNPKNLMETSVVSQILLSELVLNILNFLLFNLCLLYLFVYFPYFSWVGLSFVDLFLMRLLIGCLKILWSWLTASCFLEFSDFCLFFLGAQVHGFPADFYFFGFGEGF